MKFESMTITNFRNFENVKINIANKNIFFGLNDVGKTNFMFALRYLFDKDVRKYNLIDSDFHNKRTDKSIEIMIVIDIDDTGCTDCQKLRAKLKGALLSEQTKVYIQLKAKYEKKEQIAIPELFWGGDCEHLEPMKTRGYFFDIDSVFNVLYIDSYVDLYSLFKKNINNLVRNEDEGDQEIAHKKNRKINGDPEWVYFISFGDQKI